MTAALYITEQNMGDATREQAYRMIDLLRQRGWRVKYGNDLMLGEWDDNPAFEDTAFYHDWCECLDIISKEIEP